MAGSVNFGGMVSGLDTSKIIEDLIMVDSKPLRRLENRQTDFTKKRDTFTTIKTDLLDLKNKAFELKTASSFGVFSASSSDEEALSVSASTSANEGNYSLKILSLAEAETLSGNSYEDTGNDLGLSGEILINNKSFEISSNDSLIDVRNGINALDAGVKASILKVTDNNNRLIISAETSGADKILIANVGETDILGELGLTDGTKSVRKIESGTVYSAEYTSAHSTIGSLLDLSSEVSGTVNIRNKSLSFNLGTDTLSTIRDKINDFGPGGVSASVESVTTDDATVYRLAITGTEDFADDNNILESLGILTGGTSGTYTEFQTGSLSYTDDEIVYADTNTKLTGLGAIISETITISGKNTDGSSVSDTINIENNTKISNVLSSIEEAFGNNVSASIQGGIISVVSNSAGSNYLEFGIRAGNELGGNIDFGTVSTVTEGRERLLVEGTDARILVNNIEISRDTNEINDALTGLSLTLKKVDPETELTITVERDFDVVREKIEDFVNSYNEFIDYVNENTKYDKENNIPGLLTGDNTTRSIVSRIRNAMSSTVFNHDINFNQLVQIGIESNIEGKLEIDTAKLNDALGEDIDSVISLFSTTRTTSDNDISFVYHSNKSKQGTYDVSITQAAERATAVSQAIEGEVGESGFITIADNYDNSMAVEYSADMTLDDISNSFNAEAQNTYAEIQQSSAILTVADGETAISQSTSIKDIQGVSLEENDTITIIGTNRRGNSFQRTISVDEDTTVLTLLNTIESVNDYEVSAAIDSEGRMRIEDTTARKSDFSINIESTIEGLDFGVFETVQSGRNAVNIEASVDDNNRLVISHVNYGSDSTFTLSGAESLGIEDDEFAGVDIKGTINGKEGTGKGQNLTASGDDDSTRGIAIRSTLTTGELEAEGSSQGSITLISGVADMLYNEITSITDIVDGFIEAKIDSLEYTIDSNKLRIADMNNRMEMRRIRYVRKFTQLERSLARLQSLQQRLSSSLATLPSTSSFLS